MEIFSHEVKGKDVDDVLVHIVKVRHRSKLSDQDMFLCSILVMLLEIIVGAVFFITFCTSPYLGVPLIWGMKQ